MRRYLFGFIPLPLFLTGRPVPVEEERAPIELKADRSVMLPMRAAVLAVRDAINRHPEPQPRGMSIGNCDAILVVDTQQRSTVIATEKIACIIFFSDSAEIYIDGKPLPVRILLRDNVGVARMLGRRIYDFRRKELRECAGAADVEGE